MKMSKGLMLFMACLGLVGVTGAVITSSSPNIMDNVVLAQTRSVSCYDTLTVSGIQELQDVNAATYTEWDYGKYHGQTARTTGNAIQMRSTKPSGIVALTTPGNVRKIVVEWNDGTANGRTIDIYGKNEEYTSPEDLYAASTQGTKIGSIVCGTSTELTINDNYAYFGIRSNKSALYLDSLTIYSK